MVGLVGFELAARVALEVAPVRLGRFRPRLASAQPPDLGGEQLAQAVEYPSEFGADGGQQAVAAPDLTVGLAPLADASGPFDGPGGVSLVDIGGGGTFGIDERFALAAWMSKPAPFFRV